MFAIGDYVISGSNGICLVQEITTLNISGVDKNRKYNPFPRFLLFHLLMKKHWNVPIKNISARTAAKVGSNLV